MGEKCDHKMSECMYGLCPGISRAVTAVFGGEFLSDEQPKVAVDSVS